MSRVFTVSVTGLADVERRLNPTPLLRDIDRVTEAYTHKIANDAAVAAPRKTGRLANSIPASVKKEGECMWSLGSDLPYALKQEYEHKTKKGFVRKSVWNNRTPYRNKISEEIRHLGR
mgnify:CR=1 FL=1